MNGELSDPIAVVTTLQPILVFWVAGINFFVTLALVALFSRGRRWHELLSMFVVGFVVLTALGIVGTEYLLDLSVVQFEWIPIRNA
ncbi:MAG: hypothetical protein ABEL76_05980 [Bradymonadaceae bacterium]